MPDIADVPVAAEVPFVVRNDPAVEADLDKVRKGAALDRPAGGPGLDRMPVHVETDHAGSRGSRHDRGMTPERGHR